MYGNKNRAVLNEEEEDMNLDGKFTRRDEQ